MPHLAISLLGAFEVKLAGQAVSGFQSDKARALLAYLAVEADRPHRRERLAGLLWPDFTERSARTNLRSALANLRQVIGDHGATPPFLLVTRQTIQFNADSNHWLDVATFTMLLNENKGDHLSPDLLEEAVALYQGPFLAGFTLADSAAFEQWLLQQREALAHQIVAVVRRLVSYYEQQGRYEQALPLARRQVTLEPWDEMAHRQLMHLLALNGQRSAALAQFEACRDILAQDLGVEPGSETSALYEKIRVESLSQTIGKPPEFPLSRHNIPTQITPFVGRDKELTNLTALLADPAQRLITLVGPGGVGKTRLALEVATTQLEHFADGVYVISLAPLVTADSLVPTVARALKFSFYEGTNPQKQLLDYLRQKRILLIMDNFEQLLAGIDFVIAMLQSAPELKVLTTSRVSLNVQGEQRVTLSGLHLPDQASLKKKLAAEASAPSEAVALFVQSARRVQSDFVLSDENVIAIVQICHLVQGMPLGILMAATWIDMLTPAEIAGRILGDVSQSLDFFQTALRDVPDRQRSLRTVFDHSWQLLTGSEQIAFQQLSIFREGFTAQAAQAVAEVSLHTLKALLNKSLLQRTTTGRYEIHELLRQYAAEKLEQSPSINNAVLKRHSAFYTTFLQQQEFDLRSARQHTALAKMLAEQDNIRLAWNQALAGLPDTLEYIACIDRAVNGLGYFYEWQALYQAGEVAFRSAEEKLAPIASGQTLAVLARIYRWHGVFSHHLGNFDQADHLFQKSLTLLDNEELMVTTTQEDKAIVLLSFGDYLLNRGDHETARSYLEQALEVTRPPQLRPTEADVLRVLGSINLSQGYFKVAGVYFKQALQIFQEIGDQRNIGVTLRGLGISLERQGNYSEAIIYYQQALDLNRLVGYRHGEGNVLTSLGYIFMNQGSYTTATTYFQQVCDIRRETGNKQGQSQGLLSLGFAAHFQGQYAEAENYYHKSLRLARDTSSWRVECMTLSYLGLLAHNLGNQQIALAYCQQALQIAKEFGDRSNEGYVLTHLGHAFTSLGRLVDAAKSYRQAVLLRRELGQPQLSMEPLAGLARVSLIQQNLSRAMGYIEEILDHLKDQTLYSTDEPFRIYLTCYQILQAGQDDRATEVLELAYNGLQKRAAKINDNACQRSFLTNIAVHKEVIETWEIQR